MKAIVDKSRHLLSGKNKFTANINGNIIESEGNQVLHGKTIGSNLSFNKHINNLCKKASAELNYLARISSYVNLSKRRIINNEIIYSISIWLLSIDLDVP